MAARRHSSAPTCQQLGLKRNLTCPRVTTYDGQEKEVKAVKVKISLYLRDQSSKFLVNGYSLDELQIASNPTIDETFLNSWTHLNDLKFPHVRIEDVKVLISADQIVFTYHGHSKQPLVGVTWKYRPSSHLPDGGSRFWCCVIASNLSDRHESRSRREQNSVPRS